MREERISPKEFDSDDSFLSHIQSLRHEIAVLRAKRDPKLDTDGSECSQGFADEDAMKLHETIFQLRSGTIEKASFPPADERAYGALKKVYEGSRDKVTPVLESLSSGELFAILRHCWEKQIAFSKIEYEKENIIEGFSNWFAGKQRVGTVRNWKTPLMRQHPQNLLCCEVRRFFESTPEIRAAGKRVGGHYSTAEGVCALTAADHAVAWLRPLNEAYEARHRRKVPPDAEPLVRKALLRFFKTRQAALDLAVHDAKDPDARRAAESVRGNFGKLAEDALGKREFFEPSLDVRNGTVRLRPTEALRKLQLEQALNEGLEWWDLGRAPSRHRMFSPPVLDSEAYTAFLTYGDRSPTSLAVSRKFSHGLTPDTAVERGIAELSAALMTGGMSAAASWGIELLGETTAGALIDSVDDEDENLGVAVEIAKAVRKRDASSLIEKVAEKQAAKARKEMAEASPEERRRRFEAGLREREEKAAEAARRFNRHVIHLPPELLSRSGSLALEDREKRTAELKAVREALRARASAPLDRPSVQEIGRAGAKWHGLAHELESLAGPVAEDEPARLTLGKRLEAASAKWLETKDAVQRADGLHREKEAVHEASASRLKEIRARSSRCLCGEKNVPAADGSSRRMCVLRRASDEDAEAFVARMDAASPGCAAECSRLHGWYADRCGGTSPESAALALLEEQSAADEQARKTAKAAAAETALAHASADQELKRILGALSVPPVPTPSAPAEAGDCTEPSGMANVAFRVADERTRFLFEGEEGAFEGQRHEGHPGLLRTIGPVPGCHGAEKPLVLVRPDRRGVPGEKISVQVPVRAGKTTTVILTEDGRMHMVIR